ncbi:MAG: acetyl-CoA carboxylase biotin carboxylase subunit [Lactobacillus sp.]|nr:acetyl-CoA carboxylase biotin carboxylase subunit [Lactobacillus sp.]MDN6042878.1 acetyl-CoA carboxylase biotin carboxylase subunit [Lactobacillus sp.]MDN6052810.1 acetyl-CoA carboxylase biotin carboxylase subunit [Lactobacillus sp.]
MFSKVLIANRGEIAVQVIRALHEMGIKAVAIYSTVDKDSLYVKMADEAVCIGGPQPSVSYLNMSAVITAATLTGCEAIHPGYGFLSENAEFAQLCEQCGIKFIGPSHQSIEQMGDKANAKAAMKANGVPTIPGSDGCLPNYEAALALAHKIGYPVMLKAVAGGGGKGIRQAYNDAELEQAYAEDKHEVKLSYSDDRLYMEKKIDHAKHIEMQIIADSHGHVVYLPERDCSMQRNHQKVIEESPCQLISPAERAALGKVVVKAIKAIHYENTGTFEFLVDESHHFYFMEMNTRLQVEHTVTEEVTGIELIKGQIIIAAGGELPFTQADAAVKGYAIECRINAEDPSHDFRPSPGRIKELFMPDGTLGVRIDSGVTTNSMISPYYDSMITKLVAHMPDRERGVTKMKRMLKEVRIKGVKINRDFLYDLLSDPVFVKGTFNNNYLETGFLKGWVAQHATK